MNISNVNIMKEVFRVKPYTLKMGTKRLQQIYKIDQNDIIEARRYYTNRRNIQVNKIDLIKSNAKILILDIETAPLRAYV